jgi:hypothetical protein
MRWEIDFGNPETREVCTIVVALDPASSGFIESLRARNDPYVEVKEMALAIGQAYKRVGKGFEHIDIRRAELQ